MKLKRVFAAVTAFAMCAALAGCGAEAAVSESAAESAVESAVEAEPETEETASKEVNVTGVYCVSGAKARFKPVEVLLTGDDYAVVRSAGSTEKLRLRPGDEIIVAARDLYDGKVVS